MTRKEILEESAKIVTTDRDKQYGEPEDNFKVIASLWEPYIKAKCVSKGANVCILPEDIAILMCLLKIARTTNGEVKADNFIDLAGYAACGGEIATEKKVYEY